METREILEKVKSGDFPVEQAERYTSVRNRLTILGLPKLIPIEKFGRDLEKSSFAAASRTYIFGKSWNDWLRMQAMCSEHGQAKPNMN